MAEELPAAVVLVMRDESDPFSSEDYHPV